MRAERRAFVAILASRAWSVAVAFTAAAALLNTFIGGRSAVPIADTSLAVFGITLVLTAALRERGSVRQSAGLTAIAMAAPAGWAFLLAGPPPDVLAALTRIVAFAILGEAYLWRVVTAVRGLQRWREVRDDAALALGVIVIAALLPGPIDRGSLPFLALAVALTGAVAMSLARSAEELSLAGGDIEGRPVGSAAGGTALTVGVLAIVVAFALPTIEALLARVAPVAGAILETILLAVLLPLGYIAEAVIAVVLWLRDLIGQGRSVPLRLPVPPLTDEEIAAQARALEATRPIFIGAIEVVLALVALAFAVALVMRIARERAAAVGEGVSVLREAVEGVGLAETLAGLFPQRRLRPRPPYDDGTARTRVVRLYWRLLDLAERDGPGRRDLAETPAEHEARLLGSGSRWRDASVVVRAFEDVRYGEREPDETHVAQALAALHSVEATR